MSFFCQAYTFGLCEISDFNFMWLIEDNYPPKAHKRVPESLLLPLIYILCSQVRPQRIPSPYRINSDLNLQRIMIRPAKILFYNRVAKAGSQSITALFHALKKKNGFDVDSRNTVQFYDPTTMVTTKRELLIVTPEVLQLQLTKMLRTTTPMVFIQHYSFIDFSKFGYDWSPDWFNIVRDPVEKVISYFYYRRAGWVIADRLRVFPDEKLESVDYFKKDFESCVLKGMY